MKDNATLLELDGVSKLYESPGGREAPHVLQGVSLRVAAGEALSITGPSGSGKSTLLNIIAGLDRPTDGRVLLDGRDLAKLDDKALAAVRSSEIGLVFQLHHLLPQCTALENVLVPTIPRRRHDGEPPEARARWLLELVGLGGRLSHRPGQLSGGERQRVATVRALINRPKLLLADEPTGSLDRAAAESLVSLLIELNRQEGVALIVATHAADLARRIGAVLELCDATLRPLGARQ